MMIVGARDVHEADLDEVSLVKLRLKPGPELSAGQIELLRLQTREW